MTPRADNVTVIIRANSDRISDALAVAEQSCAQYIDSNIILSYNKQTGIGYYISRNYSRKTKKLTSISVTECE